jgi:hypothetical protein
MFNVFSPTGLPGFRVRPQDDVPGFDIDENGLPRRERPWSDGMRPGSGAPQYPDLAQAMMPTPGPEDSVQPAPPQPPDHAAAGVVEPVPPTERGRSSALWNAVQSRHVLSDDRPERAGDGRRARLRSQDHPAARPERRRRARCRAVAVPRRAEAAGGHRPLGRRRAWRSAGVWRAAAGAGPDRRSARRDAPSVIPGLGGARRGAAAAARLVHLCGEPVADVRTALAAVVVGRIGPRRRLVTGGCRPRGRRRAWRAAGV